MKRLFSIMILVLSTMVLLVACTSSHDTPAPSSPTNSQSNVAPAAQWAQTVAYGTSSSTYSGSTFHSVITDSNGNIYAAGNIGSGTYFFGNGVTASCNATTGCILLIKYNSSGAAQWAQTSGAGSSFTSVSVDSNGNIYAVGHAFNGTYNFGNGVTLTAGGLLWNILLVKYNSSGVAQWAQSLISGSSYAAFNAVGVDTNGNVYAAGYIGGSGIYNFGNSVTAAGAYSGNNIILVKYNNSGVPQWAQTVSSAPAASNIKSIALDSSGNVYAIGSMDIGQLNPFNFGNNVTVTSLQDLNVFLLKYNSSGAAQWVQTIAYGSDWLSFDSVSVDSNGNIYAAGSITHNGSFNFGNNVVLAANPNAYPGETNILLVKYNSSGLAQWVQSVSYGSGLSSFSSVNVDSIGNIYAAGRICYETWGGLGTFGFGNGVTATAVYTYNDTILVKYSPSGEAQWATTVTDKGNSGMSSYFTSVAVDGSGDIYAAGYIEGNWPFNFGNNVTVTGAGGVSSGGSPNSSILLVKY